MSEPDADPMDQLDPLQELHELTRALRRHLQWQRRAGAYAAQATPTARPEGMELYDVYEGAPHDVPHDVYDDARAAKNASLPAAEPAMARSDRAPSRPQQRPQDAQGGSRPPMGSMSAALAAALGEEPRPKRPAPVSPRAQGQPGEAGVTPAPARSGLTLAEVRADLGDCQRCKLSASRTHIVFGSGDPGAALMFVGEAPGEQEDLSGQPFVGRAGELLEAMITAMGWTRDSVYIANVLKCRPPQNRDPEADEIAACRPFLTRQIQAVAPRVIVALGRPAAHLLLDTDAPMHALRGRFHAHAGIKVMPTFHPSYLLRAQDPRTQRERKRQTWEDLKQVIAELGRLGVRTPLSPRA